MKFISGYSTDIGIKKNTNQDSLLILQAETEYGEVIFALVCDGMGGLKKGEVASADVIIRFSNWFKSSFGELIKSGSLDEKRLRDQWKALINNRDDAISAFGAHNGIRLGTTISGVLIFQNKYYAVNVGDSRVYLLADRLYQITHDHTVVQEKIDRGEITVQQALVDPQRSVLLQCIGAGDFLNPDFFSGPVAKNQVFLICCDGFRHMVSPEELFNSFRPDRMNSTKTIETALKKTIETLKSRRETDNITAIVVKTC